MATSHEAALDLKPGARGRKDNSGQAAVINLEKLVVKSDELVKLYNKASDAATDFSEAIKAVAEKAGLNASTVRKYITAKAGDKYDDTKEKIKQLALVFDVES
jgi:hypothetical protein